MSDFQHAQLDWDENGQPLSRAFGDVYFSRHSGLNEIGMKKLFEQFDVHHSGVITKEEFVQHFQKNC